MFLTSMYLCTMNCMPGRDAEYGRGRGEDVFWQPGWRSKLCKCAMCISMLIDRGVGFLLDEPEPTLDDDDDEEQREAGGEPEGREIERERDMRRDVNDSVIFLIFL